MRTTARLALAAGTAVLAGTSLVAPAAGATTGDTTPPVFERVSVTPSSVDLTDPQLSGQATVSVSVDARDDAELGTLRASAQRGDVVVSDSSSRAGLSADTFTLSLTFVRGMQSGPVPVTLRLTDAAGNVTTTTRTVDVTAGPRDLAGPTGRCAPSVPSVDVRSAAASVPVRASLEDPAGFDRPWVLAASPVDPWQANLDARVVTQDGTRQVAERILTVPKGTAPGTTIRLEAQTSDRLGNGAQVWCEDLYVRHGTTQTGRIAGRDRYATSAELYTATEAAHRTVYVASGTGYADALSGAGAREATGGVLLVPRDGLPAEVRSALSALRPDRIVVLGGTASVSAAVEQQLWAYQDDGVTRVTGRDRYETSALVARRSIVTGKRVILASGADFPDALAAAGNRGDATVLLSDPRRLHPATAAALRALRPSQVILAGAVWPRGYDVSVHEAAGTRPVVLTWGGRNRYETAAMFAPAAPQGGGYLVSGAVFPDALSIASHAHGRPVYLTAPTALPAPTAAALEHYRLTALTAVGGTSGVSDEVLRRAAAVAQDSRLP